MRSRLFFILLFVGSVLVSAVYFFNFLTTSHPSTSRLGFNFAVLITLSVILQMYAHWIRAFKSHYLLDRIRESKTSTLFQGLAVGDLFNSLLPFRLGEFIRAYYIGDAMAISKTTVFMSIVIERLVDGIILGLTFLSAAFLIRSTSESGFTIMIRLGAGLLVLSLLLGIAIKIIKSQRRWMLRLIHSLSRIFNVKVRSRLRFMAWSGIYGTRLMLSRKRTVRKYYAASLFMWLVYFCSTAVAALAFFDLHNWSKTWYITQSAYASVSTPAGPGYVGTFHVVMSGLLGRINLAPGSFSLFLWLIVTVPISIVGLFVLVRQRFEKKDDITSQEALINKLHRETDISRELRHFLDAYFKGEEINQVITQAELDGKFKLIKSFKRGSNAHTVLAWRNQELTVKKITLPQYAEKLADQAHWLLERRHLPHLPRVIRQDNTAQYYSFDLAYNEAYFPFFDYIHSHSSDNSYRILQQVLTYMDTEIYQPQPARQGRQDLLRYIEEKVIGKINDTAVMSSQISQLQAYPKLKINGSRYDNIFEAIEKIKRNPKAMKDLSTYSESPIHGDLTIDNIIASSEGDFMILDPNNENQVSAPVVDFGKLYQSLHSGYEFLIQLEDCSVKEGVIQYEDAKSQKYGELYSRVDGQLKKSLAPHDYRSLLFHEAVHYCRMLTYRANINAKTIAVFYAVAVRLFNEFLAQYDK